MKRDYSAKESRQKGKGKREKAKGKREKAKGKRELSLLPFAFSLDDAKF
jgi:hypothetical protein